MDDQQRVRLTLDGPVTPAQLRRLRAEFPPLGAVPPGALRERLSACSRFVVGNIATSDSLGVLARLREEGLFVELAREYGTEYLRQVLPGPLEWLSATERAEVIFMPAFSPEVVVRFWSGSGIRMHLASLNVMASDRHFSVARWLTSASEDAGPEEVLHEESGASSFGLGVFTDALPPLAVSDPAVGIIDGISVHLVMEAAEKRAERSFHSATPSEQPAAHAWLMRVLSAASCLTSSESRERLRDVASYFHE